MSFLKVGALWALPLVLLPLVIHWLHRRRHRTVAWPAMIFLRRADRHRRNPEKLRRWLILAARVLVVAAVILAFARPLSSGVFGIAANRVTGDATAIVLLDRSPSMQLRSPAGLSRQAAGLENIAATLETLGQREIVLIDSVREVPQTLSSPRALVDPMVGQAAASEADLPEMLDRALQYLNANRRGTADIWICGDRERSAWQPNDSMWQPLSERLASPIGGITSGGIRIHHLDFSDAPRNNHSVSVSQLRSASAERGSGVLLSIAVRCSDGGDAIVPVGITIGNVTTSVDVNVSDGQGELSNHFVAVPETMPDVFGVVSIAADVNPADDRWYFVAASENRPKLALVTDATSHGLIAAAEVLGDIVFQSVSSPATESSPRLPAAWPGGDPTCLLWQGVLPAGEDAANLQRFVQDGGGVVFFPPRAEDAGRSFAGVGWGRWNNEVPAEANYDDYAFPLNTYRAIEGDTVSRASIGDQRTLIGRRRLGQGNAWFCGADVLADDGRFVQDGVALFGLLSEAITASRRRQGGAVSWVAGQTDAIAASTDAWTAAHSSVVLADQDTPPRWSEFGHHAGVYRLRSEADSPGRLRAVNRPLLSADEARPLSDDQLSELLPGVPWNVVAVDTGGGGSARGFVREIWSVVWLVVIVGLLAEACLSIPPGAAGGKR